MLKIQFLDNQVKVCRNSSSWEGLFASGFNFLQYTVYYNIDVKATSYSFC